MTINESKQGAVTIVQAQGRLDATSAPETDRRLAALITAGARQVVFDLSGLDYVSSAGRVVKINHRRRFVLLSTFDSRCIHAV